MESESLIEWGLEIPRDYLLDKEDTWYKVYCQKI